jgi:hypothetical protein
MSHRRARLIGLFSLVVAANGGVDFNREIQPILSENCYHCHGPDARAREADFRLDKKEDAYRTQDGITVIKPGDPSASDLVERIFSTDEDDRMPPTKSNRSLTPAQKELIKRWVAEGAPWADHWAFVPPKRPELPEEALMSRFSNSDWRTAGLSDWRQNPIDAFVLERLSAEGITPSREAAPGKIIRRLTLDVTGLPPTVAEVDHFVREYQSAPIEIRKTIIDGTVDRLLASPRFGERMVWEWLDAARYADTNGYQGDPTRAMWYWRDWAVEAFNRNMPFDQFTIEQIAGDLLPGPTRSQLIATGFHRNHMINGEGGRIPEESRVDYVQDRVETTGTVWLGLTLNCCRCHDHKFDPISQREYYQLSAYFNSVDESGANDAGGLANPILSMATPEQEAKIASLKVDEAKARNERNEVEKRLRAEQPQWESTMRVESGTQGEPKWNLLKPYEVFSEQGTELRITDDGSVVAGGPSPEKDDYLLNIDSSIGEITGFKIEALPDEAFKNGGPGRATDFGNFVLSEVELQGSGKPVDLAAVTADFEQGGLYTAAGAVDGDTKTGWAIYPETGKPHTLTLEARNKVGYGSQVQLSFRLRFRYGQQHTLGRFKIYATTDNAALLRPLPEKFRTLIAQLADQRSAADQQALTKYYLDTHPDLALARKRRDAAKRAREIAEKDVPRTMVMRERESPRETFILTKGAYDKHAERVEPGTPAILSKLPADSPRNRAGLARWLTAPENPLTARVTVNRIWQQFFGIGLVKTPDDFGVQGDKPSHPELLDWLAVDFRESGWDVKRLVKLMLTSATYRQSAVVPEGMAERDPENRLLARGSRYRWPSWMIRDQALAISELLVEKVGGPPVKGYQPPGIWEDATFGQIKYTQDSGAALYRRSLYTFWRRIVGPTTLFDVSNRQICSVKTQRTNTPMHALTTLNDVTYVEAARAFAQRIAELNDSDEVRTALAFRTCTSRAPSPTESAVLKASLNRLRQTYSADEESAKQLINVGESKTNSLVAPAELAAWTSLTTLLLNLDETLTKE